MRSPHASIILGFLAALLLPSARIQAKARPRKKASPTPAATPSATPTPPLAPGELPIFAEGAFLIDGLTGDPLYQKNPDHAYYPASTTKILTALIVIEAGNLDQEVTIEPGDTHVEPSSLDMKPGEKFTRMQMLYGLLLKSANDVALALARDNAGSVQAFAEKMNRRARELGATASNFENPNGLHNKDHYTTPHDLALIARAAMEQPLFHKIVGTLDYTWLTEAGPVPLVNHNKLLTRFPGCTGVKTGYTVPAQQVLVSAAMRDGREVISVVMHTDHPGIWQDSKILLNYGFSHLSTFP
jgi:D-alanyl-D-alanine carboxypeptidase (penicillin-binding protein 5/6)